MFVYTGVSSLPWLPLVYILCLPPSSVGIFLWPCVLLVFYFLLLFSHLPATHWVSWHSVIAEDCKLESEGGKMLLTETLLSMCRSTLSEHWKYREVKKLTIKKFNCYTLRFSTNVLWSKCWLLNSSPQKLNILKSRSMHRKKLWWFFFKNHLLSNCQMRL